MSVVEAAVVESPVKPVVDSPTVVVGAASVVEYSVVDDSVVEESVDPIVDESVEDSVVDESVEDPVVEGSVEDSVVEDPVVEGSAEDSVVEDPVVESVVDELVVEKPLTADSVVEESVVEESVAEESVVDSVVADSVGGVLSEELALESEETELEEVSPSWRGGWIARSRVCTTALRPFRLSTNWGLYVESLCSLILPVENPGTAKLPIEVTSKIYSSRKSMFGISTEGVSTVHSRVPALQPCMHLTLK
jgi:hypothetical protein